MKESRIRNNTTELRLLFLIDYFKSPTAGTEGQLYHLVDSLVRQGVTCRLIVLRRSKYLEDYGFPCPWFSLERPSLSSPFTWVALWRIGRHMRREGFALAHTFLNDVSVVGPPMLALSGIRTIVSRRDMGYWYTFVYIALLRLTRHWVAACVTNSRAVAKITEAREHIPRNRIHVIYNGQPKPRHGSEFGELATYRTEGTVLVGLVANIRPIKRISDLIDAVALLRENTPAVHAIIIGDGQTGPLEERASQLNISERIHFLGPREDIGNYLAQLDMGILCSESEGFSNSIVEYMRAGIPTVCTESGGNPEAIRHEETGLLYQVGDIRQLAGCLRRLASNRDERLRMGHRARAESERFTMERMVDEHLTLYKRLLN